MTGLPYLKPESNSLRLSSNMTTQSTYRFQAGIIVA